MNIWARNTGKRIAVKVPAGRYLLVQAGKQFEHLSGGLIQAGFHEVVVNDATIAVSSHSDNLLIPLRTVGLRVPKAMEKVQKLGTRPLIRISSTFFWHLSSDYILEPIPSLQEAATDVKAQSGEDNGDAVTYEKMRVGTQVQKCVSLTLVLRCLDRLTDPPLV